MDLTTTACFRSSTACFVPSLLSTSPLKPGLTRLQSSVASFKQHFSHKCETGQFIKTQRRETWFSRLVRTWLLPSSLHTFPVRSLREKQHHVCRSTTRKLLLIFAKHGSQETSISTVAVFALQMERSSRRQMQSTSICCPKQIALNNLHNSPSVPVLSNESTESCTPEILPFVICRVASAGSAAWHGFCPIRSHQVTNQRNRSTTWGKKTSNTFQENVQNLFRSPIVFSGDAFRDV